jgi:cobalt/nickel transport protein
MMNNQTFIVSGIVFALIIGVLGVFLASGDPDGLESTALVVSGQKDLAGPSPDEGDPEAVGAGTFSYESPMPDYSLGHDMGSSGGVIAMIAGIIITILVVIGSTYAIRMSSPKTKT